MFGDHLSTHILGHEMSAHSGVTFGQFPQQLVAQALGEKQPRPNRTEFNHRISEDFGKNEYSLDFKLKMTGNDVEMHDQE